MPVAAAPRPAPLATPPTRWHLAAIWAIATWPLFNFLGTNWDAVHARGPRALGGIVLFTVALASGGHVLYRWLARRGRGGSVVVGWLVFVCLFFGYAAVRDAFASLFGRLDWAIPPFAGYVAVAAVTIGVAWRWRRDERVRIGSLVFSFGASALSLAMFVMSAARIETRAAPADVATAAAASHAVGGRANIFYIILDAYPGVAGLRANFGFDNGAFLARMREHGFRDVSSERSNYFKTSQEIGAIFLLDYPQNGSMRADADPDLLYPTLLDRKSAPPLLRRLRAVGYTPWHSASVWGECPWRQFRCLGQSSFLVPDYITQAYFANTPLGRPMLHVLEWRQDALASIARDFAPLLRSGTPVFVFGHHLSPHPPYLLDAQCERRDPADDSWNAWDPESRPAFLGALQCVNRRVEKLVADVLRLDPDAMIVLQGDHGSAFSVDWKKPVRTWPDAVLRERASFLNLVRAPERCARWLDRPLGQVNTARFVVGCAEGRAPEFLPEQTWVGSYAGPDEKTLTRWSR